MTVVEQPQGPFDHGPLKRSLADAIRVLIADGTLPLGARISDKALAAELGVSRTPVREAILALVGEGLVSVRPQSGTFVFRPDAGEIAALCAFRALLEAGAVRLAPDRDSLARTLSRLCDGAEASLAAGDLAACERADTAFHEAIVAASANPDLIAAHRGIAARVRALRHTLPATRGRVAAANAAHRAIATALAAGESERAAGLLAAHVEGVARLLGAAPIRVP